MTIIQRNALVPYSNVEMFKIVNTVENYPQFLNWCQSSEVHTRTEDEVRATLTLAHAHLKKSFTTCNRLQQNKMIEIRLINGPFKHLEGFWRFENLDPHGCKILFDLEFEFINKLMSLTIEPIFNQIANSLVDAFCQRAVELYGPRELSSS